MKIYTNGGGTVLRPPEKKRCIHEYNDGGVSMRCVREAGAHKKHFGWLALSDLYCEWKTERPVLRG